MRYCGALALMAPRCFPKPASMLILKAQPLGPKRSMAVRRESMRCQCTRARGSAYRSQVDGVMYAYGHDLHGSIALGLRLPSIGFENTSQTGWLRWGDWLHIAPDIAAGTFGSRTGAVSRPMSSSSLLPVRWRMAGAAPYKIVDAIAIAATFVNEVQKVVSREMPADEGAVVTIVPSMGAKRPTSFARRRSS